MSFARAMPRSDPGYIFTVSARNKKPGVPVFRFLRNHFGYVPLERIGSVFGFVEQSTLYGGRLYKGRELSNRDVFQLNNAGIGIRLPLSNHFVTREEYEAAGPLLAKYHNRLNSVIVTNDDLAVWIRQDYPDYRIDASVIKNIDNTRKLRQALYTYDEVVLPMRSNEDDAFLDAIVEKDRITLFANAGCAFNCPAHTCYVSTSRINKGDADHEWICSQSVKERELLGMIDFDLDALVRRGFHSFKLLRPAPGRMTGF